jgi:hypothetical protein
MLDFDATRVEHRLVKGTPAVVYEAIRYSDPASGDGLQRGRRRARLTRQLATLKQRAERACGVASQPATAGTARCVDVDDRGGI